MQGLLGTLSGRQPYQPILDGVVLPDDPLRIINEGRHNNVPVILGTTANEGTLFLIGARLDSAADYRAVAESTFGDRAAALAFVCPARAFGRAFAANQPRTYVYQFAHAMTTGAVRSLGAFHGLELAFVFRFRALPGLRPTGEEITLSDAVSDYWVQFARTGDPNGGRLPLWPAYTPAGDGHQVLAVPISSGSGLGRDACAF